MSSPNSLHLYSAPGANSNSSRDSDRLRQAFGCFTTGVAIVTARGAEGLPLGMTINSLASLSLDPPLLLWSLARSSHNHSSFSAAKHFAVHVLHQGQAELVQRFQRRDVDRFAGLALQYDQYGLPLLDDYLIRFECASEPSLAGGDHSIVIGRIIGIDEHEGEPLVMFRSRPMRLAINEI